jgi:hypothetical protein
MFQSEKVAKLVHDLLDDPRHETDVVDEVKKYINPYVDTKTV